MGYYTAEEIFDEQADKHNMNEDLLDVLTLPDRNPDAARMVKGGDRDGLIIFPWRTA